MIWSGTGCGICPSYGCGYDCVSSWPDCRNGCDYDCGNHFSIGSEISIDFRFGYGCDCDANLRDFPNDCGCDFANHSWTENVIWILNGFRCDCGES